MMILPAATLVTLTLVLLLQITSVPVSALKCCQCAWSEMAGEQCGCEENPEKKDCSKEKFVNPKLNTTMPPEEEDENARLSLANLPDKPSTEMCFIATGKADYNGTKSDVLYRGGKVPNVLLATEKSCTLEKNSKISQIPIPKGSFGGKADVKMDKACGCVADWCNCQEGRASAFEGANFNLIVLISFVVSPLLSF